MAESNEDQCCKILFIISGYHIELKFTALDGCVEILDEDSKIIQEICHLQTKPELSLYDVIKINSSNGFRLNYTMLLSYVQGIYIFGECKKKFSVD